MHEAKLSHENLRKGVFVTAGGDWKIGGLHLVTGFTSPQTDLNQLAIVLWEVFNGFNDAITRPQAPGKIPQRIHELYKKIGAQSAARLAVCDIIKDNPKLILLFLFSFKDFRISTHWGILEE